MNNLPHIAEAPRQVQASLQHLQKCVMALDKIREIAGSDSVIGRLATHAISNKPYNMGDS